MKTTKGKIKKDYILDKAKEVFLTKGYSSTTIADIVEHSGVSKGSIYYHFDSKETLFFKLIERKSIEWKSIWKEKEKKYDNIIDKFYGIAEYYAIDSQNPLTKITEEFYISNPERNEEILNKLLGIMRSPRELYVSLINEAIESGFIPKVDSKELAIIFSGLMDGLSATYYEYSESEMKNIYKKAVTYFLNGVLNK
ncbi:TetR/AcrR family transcriptional regulator [Peribacillus sp. NPDC006672]|uniref:TetR/AcrR family transcriptional regulator n=1 Tax=Peribacillus sp. NPDC006672 TaxID=3390606 RepID=UPI003CFCAEDF